MKTADASLPARGAWIEIKKVVSEIKACPGRSPQGERGLKSGGHMPVKKTKGSLPARGAWIEITILHPSMVEDRVAPRKGSVD